MQLSRKHRQRAAAARGESGEVRGSPAKLSRESIVEAP